MQPVQENGVYSNPHDSGESAVPFESELPMAAAANDPQQKRRFLIVLYHVIVVNYLFIKSIKHCSELDKNTKHN